MDLDDWIVLFMGIVMFTMFISFLFYMTNGVGNQYTKDACKKLGGEQIFNTNSCDMVTCTHLVNGYDECNHEIKKLGELKEHGI